MPEAGLHVEGLPEVVRALHEIGVEVEDPQQALSEIADEAAEIIESAAPKRSGRLAGGIRGSRSKGRAVVTSGAVHSGPINYGWERRNIAATRYMQAADDRADGFAIQQLEDNINAEIRRQGLNQ